MTVVHVIVPGAINDPARPSGGNTYDRRICQELAANGWNIREHPIPGTWPRPDAAARAAVNALLTALAGGTGETIVLLDGLIASAMPGLSVWARRLPLVILVHMIVAQGIDDTADARAREAAALSAATTVITTSTWTKLRLTEQYSLRPGRIHVIEPGVDAAAPVRGSASGGELLCVAAVTPAKGQDLLVAALAEMKSQRWSCVCVGALDLDPGFVGLLVRTVRAAGMVGRVRFVGSRIGADLRAAYAAADIVVLCSRTETYGMVVTEALARGIPVIATEVGGVPEALGDVHGSCEGANRPGLLVRPDDPQALAATLRVWLGDAALRLSLREAALRRRETLVGWSVAAARFGDVLARSRR